MACFSHAASVALVAALCGLHVREAGALHPCGVFELHRDAPGAPFRVVSTGEQAPFLSARSATTKAWGVLQNSGEAVCAKW